MRHHTLECHKVMSSMWFKLQAPCIFNLGIERSMASFILKLL